MKYVFTEVRPFLDFRDRCFDGDEDFREFQNDLAADPKRWGVIPGCAPLRKARWSGRKSQKSKSGGCRVIYMQVPDAGVIYLIHVYRKGRQENLSAQDAKILTRLAKKLRRDELAKLGRRK